jgi:exosome complex RNA-binding protein Csl4
MKKTLLLLVLLAAGAAHAAITATIFGEDGKPLAGARVRAYPREDTRAWHVRLLSKTPETAPIITATSGDDGKVALDVKGNAVVRLVADMPGRAVAAVECVDGDDLGGLMLPSAAARKGRITATGNGVAGAVVALGPWYVTHSDAQGNYELPAQASAFERLAVVHPDFAPSEATVAPMETRQRTNPLEVALVKGAAVRGRVVAANGTTPIAAATLTVAGWPLASSGDDGSFAIAHAPSSWRSIIASSGRLAGVAMNRHEPLVIVKAVPSLAISGTVKAGDQPVPGVLVSLFGEAEGVAPAAVSDGKGRFVIDGLQAGRYSLVGAHPDYVIARVPVELPADGPRTLSADRLTRVRGHVVDEEHKPVAAARIAASFLANGPLPPVAPQNATSGVDGAFTLRWREGSSVQLVATHRGYAVAILDNAAIDKSRDVTITMPAGFPMIIRVVDAQREPVARVTIDLFRASENGERRAALPCIETTDDCKLTRADGTFETLLVPGKYDILAGGDEIAPKRLAAQALTARSSPMSITVDRGVEVSGRVVTGSDNTPVAGANIEVYAAAPHSAVSAADGTFTIRGLAAGPMALTATTGDSTPPLQSPSVAVTAPAKDVVLRIPTLTTLSGRVVERSSGAPVTDYLIAATMPEFGVGRPLPPSQIHSEDGSFRIDVIPGRIDLRVTASGYVRASLTGLTVEAGKPLGGVEVKMDRGARVVGRVTSGGQPLAQAFVSVVNDRGSGNGANSASTDAEGKFALDGVDPGDHELMARKAGYLSKRKSVTAEAGKDARLDVDLDRGREMKGRVVDRGGRPVAGARVSVRSIGDRSAGSRGDGLSDADGNFTVAGLGIDRLALQAEREGYVSARMDDVDPSQFTTVTLDRGGDVSGRVTGLSDAEAATVNVMASYPNGSAGAQADSNGNFTIHGVPDGIITVTANKFGGQMRRSTPKQVTVSNGSAPFVEIDFVEGVAVRGRVTREGKAVAGGSINYSGMHGEPSAGGPIAPDGTYQVAGLQPADYHVSVTLYGLNAPTYGETLTVTGSMNHDIDIHGSSVRGRVVDSSTGAALPDALVELRSTADRPTLRTVPTDSDGRFSFDLIQDGSYRVNVSRSQYAPKTQDLTVPGTPDVEVRLEQTAPTVVRVVDAATGAPLAATVAAMDVSRKTGGAFAQTSSEEGTAKLWLAAGRYVITASATGYIEQKAEAQVPGPEVRLALQRGGTIAFRFRAAEPVYRVRLLVEGVVVRTDALNPPYRTTINGVPAGTYTVEVTSGDGKRSYGNYPVTVTTGQTVTVDVAP